MTTIVAVTVFLQSAPARGDGLGPKDFFDDAGQYFTAPLRWDAQEWLYFGGTVAAIGAAHTVDGTVRDHFVGKHPVLDGQDPNSTRDAVPALALFGGTWLLSTAVGNQYGKGESHAMIEAGIFSSITVEGLSLPLNGRDPTRP